MNAIKTVVVGARVIVATRMGMVEGLIIAADASARISGDEVFMVGVGCGDDMMVWRERRVSAAELSAIATAASTAGVTVAAYVRQALAREEAAAFTPSVASRASCNV